MKIIILICVSSSHIFFSLFRNLSNFPSSCSKKIYQGGIFLQVGVSVSDRMRWECSKFHLLLTFVASLFARTFSLVMKMRGCEERSWDSIWLKARVINAINQNCWRCTDSARNAPHRVKGVESGGRDWRVNLLLSDVDGYSAIVCNGSGRDEGRKSCELLMLSNGQYKLDVVHASGTCRCPHLKSSNPF